MGARLITPAQLERADALLGRCLGELSRVTLGRATRWLDQLDAVEPVTDRSPRVGDKVTPRLVSTLLQRRGFRKVGLEGSGYDREPVYERRAS